MAIRRRTHEILEKGHEGDTLSRVVDGALVALILLNILAVVAQSVASWDARYARLFTEVEVVSVYIFSVEYLLRVWSSVEVSPGTGFRHAVVARLRYMLTPMAVVDLLAVLPFFVFSAGLMGNLDTRVLRALRLVRMFKLTRYWATMDLLLDVLKENSRAFGAAISILLIVMLIAATGIHLFERQAQPEAFGSIPASMWWAFATLTTVGYGDVTPITVGGKVFGAMITVVSIGMVAMPAGILASSFSERLRVRAGQYSDLARRALADGVLTVEEQRMLEQAREALGISEEMAREILARSREQRLRDGGLEMHCPHCGKSLLQLPENHPEKVD